MRHLMNGAILIVLMAGSVFAAGDVREVVWPNEGANSSRDVDSRFAVATQPGAPICIAIDKANWKAPHWTATLTLRNCSGNEITHVEVEYIENYEQAEDVWSSDGRMTHGFTPGGELALETGGGFRGGRRYDKPVGELTGVSVGVVAVTFADGTEWHKPKS